MTNYPGPQCVPSVSRAALFSLSLSVTRASGLSAAGVSCSLWRACLTLFVLSRSGQLVHPTCSPSLSLCCHRSSTAAAAVEASNYREPLGEEKSESAWDSQAARGGCCCCCCHDALALRVRQQIASCSSSSSGSGSRIEDEKFSPKNYIFLSLSLMHSQWTAFG